MAVIPFAGALDVTVFKLPYTLPLQASLGLLWQIWQTQTQPQILADSFASVQDAFDQYTTTILRLTPSALISYPLSGSSPNQPIGTPFISDGVNMVLPDTGFPNTPQYSRYNLPGTSGPVNVAAFTNVTAPENPPFFNVYQLIRFYPVVYQGALAYRLFCQDSSFSPWYCILKPDNTFTNWVNAPIAEGAGVLDFTNNRVLIFGNGGRTLYALTFDVSGVETLTPIINTSGTGHAWLDNPNYLNNRKLGDGWLISADNGSGNQHQVPNGSPIFQVASDLSSYQELVFHPGAPNVLPNGLGIYGPPWNYTDPFFSVALTISDANGQLYYIQKNPGHTAYDVYSTAGHAPGGGSFGGTFVGFMQAGKFGGGTT